MRLQLQVVGKPLVVEAVKDSSTVHLELASQAESVALVRAMLAGVAELLDFDGELLDGLNTTVSEACNNVVKHAYDGHQGPMIVHLEADATCVEVTIRDHGIGIGIEGGPPSGDHDAVGLPLIGALADRCEVRPHPDGGTKVRIVFMRRGRGETPEAWRDAEAHDGHAVAMPGEVVGALAPVNLLGGVLGRMARLLAARARFSMERFSDLYLLFDQLAFHAARRASTPGMTFSLSSEPRRLELEIGPISPSGNASPAEWEEQPANLRVLADELTVESVDDALVLRVVVGGAGAP